VLQIATITIGCSQRFDIVADNV